MWVWVTNLGSSIKSVFTIIARVMKLENRVTILEEKIKTLQIPAKDIREGLVYNKTLNLYEDKVTGESFCPTCLGNKKRVAVQIEDNYGEAWWKCHGCETVGSDGKQPQYPSQGTTENPNYY